MNLEMPETVGRARMLEAMIEGPNTSAAWTCTSSATASAFTDRGERAQIETILADHRASSPSTTGAWARPIPRRCATTTSSGARRSGRRSRARRRCCSRCRAAITGSWFENRIIPLDAATPDQPGVAILVDAYNKESEKRAAAGKPVGLGTEAPRPKPAPGARGAARGRHVHRHRHLRRMPCAGARVLEDDQARTRAVRAGAHRPRQGPVVRRLPRDRLPAAGRAHERRATGAPALRRMWGARPATAPGSKHGAALDKRGTLARAVPEATCRGCHTADVTGGEFDYKKFVQAIVGPGHTLRRRRPAPSSIVRGSNDDLPCPRARASPCSRRRPPPRPRRPLTPRRRQLRDARPGGASGRATSPRCCRRSSNAATARRATSTARAARRPPRTCARRCRGARSRSRPTNRAWSRCPTTTRR